MEFIRKQEERLAIRYLQWQYQRSHQPVPPEGDLQARAAEIVKEAHRIARKRGRNVLAIMKELIEDIKKG